LRKIFILLLLITTGLTACSSQTDEEKALEALNKGLSEVTKLFHTSTTTGSEKDPAVPILNPEIPNKEAAKDALMVYFSEELTNEILDHYLSTETKGRYNLLNATKEGSVVPYFGYNNLKPNTEKYFIEKEQSGYKVTTPNQGFFTVTKTDGKFLITNYNK